MPETAAIPSLEELRTAFAFLDSHGFARTARIPMVAARQWKPGWEWAAWRRFRSRRANIHEVAFPHLYFQLEEPEVQRLFAALTLGRRDLELGRHQELQGLCQGQAQPSWTVLHRFGRYVLRSHPEGSGKDWVYFGDDTLFLMQRSRELLASLKGPVRCLDLCCGGGGVGLALPSFEGTLMGIDLNPTAVGLAQATAAAQGLSHYQYCCLDLMEGLRGEFELIFGNPPTLSPLLTGKDVFHATGDEDVLPNLLEKVLTALTPKGRAVFTFFSEAERGKDAQWDRLRELLTGKRGFRCYARREYPLGAGRYLRHSALELNPLGDESAQFEPLGGRGAQLPGVKARQL
ncbi:MAG: methyltransferase [Vulcanimicrobiota bacterium]